MTKKDKQLLLDKLLKSVIHETDYENWSNNEYLIDVLHEYSLNNTDTDTDNVIELKAVNGIGINYFKAIRIGVYFSIDPTVLRMCSDMSDEEFLLAIIKYGL